MREATPPLHRARTTAPYAGRVPDHTSDMRFDRIVFRLAQIIRTPIALLAFVDFDQVWIKARVGFSGPGFPRIDRLIATRAGSGTILIVEDSREDRRFADVAHGPGHTVIRFYAGAEIRATEGQPRGVLCALDTRPRQLTDEQHTRMLGLAHEAEALIRNRLNDPSQPH